MVDDLRSALERDPKAVADAVAQEVRAPQPERQSSLFGDGAAPGATPEADGGPRGRGRPPGSKNRKDEAVLAYIEANFGDLRQSLVDLHFKCKAKFEVGGDPKMAALSVQAASTVIPYLYARQRDEDPKLAVNVSENGVQVVISGGAQDGKDLTLSANDFVEIDLTAMQIGGK